MMTVKQVSSLTGVSVRTLQFYDEIGLLKPTKTTQAGYRLYDQDALEVLQQILFFKELDFSLKEIKGIMENPQFDKIDTFKKQRELVRFKRDRLDALLNLLDKLIKGEKCMDFKNFDLNGYFQMLAGFKKSRPDEIASQFGSLEAFDALVSKVKARESEVAKLAVKQYGSIENYTKAIEKNMENFLTEGPAFSKEEAKELTKKGDAIFEKLTADQTRDVASPEIQEIIHEWISFVNETNGSIDMGENYWSFLGDAYASNPAFIEGIDKKHGAGASKYISLALKTYLDKQQADKK